MHEKDTAYRRHTVAGREVSLRGEDGHRHGPARALIRQQAYQRLRALRGSEVGAREVPRRRERAAPAAHSAP
jgi:hypothetical protein